MFIIIKENSDPKAYKSIRAIEKHEEISRHPLYNRFRKGVKFVEYKGRKIYKTEMLKND